MCPRPPPLSCLCLWEFPAFGVGEGVQVLAHVVWASLGQPTFSDLWLLSLTFDCGAVSWWETLFSSHLCPALASHHHPSVWGPRCLAPSRQRALTSQRAPGHCTEGTAAPETWSSPCPPTSLATNPVVFLSRMCRNPFPSFQLLRHHPGSSKPPSSPPHQPPASTLPTQWSQRPA